MTGQNASYAGQRPVLALQMELERLRARELASVSLLALWVLARRSLRTLGRWYERSRQRRDLAELLRYEDDHLLRDIGLKKSLAQAECEKWFWQS